MNCITCAVPMLTSRRWKALDAEGRKQTTYREHAGNGECRRCRGRRVRVRRPRPDKTTRLLWVAEEWNFLASPYVSQRENVERLAPRLGLHPDTLERHLAHLRDAGVLPAVETYRCSDGRYRSRLVAA